MKLCDLIDKLDKIKVIGDTSCQIKNIIIDSNSVTKESLYICISGRENDGHNYVRQAENYGAVAIIAEKEMETTLTQIIVKDSRLAMSFLAAEFFGHVDKKMKIIGVVGTNGKTTTTHIIKKIYDTAGIKCGVIGTLGSFYDDKFYEPKLTTPDPVELHKTLYDMYLGGVKVVVMEVSAHAIVLGKVADIDFDAGVFTNFSQDHLDFFGTMEEYKKSKMSFFENYCKCVIINSDDKVGIDILKKRSDGISYGIENPSDVFAIDVIEQMHNTNFVLNLFDCIFDVKMSLLGKFNVYNALAAATTCAVLGVDTETVVKGLTSITKVDGRLECVYKGDYSVFVDYAHTPDGLEKAINVLKKISKGNIICVFGCGGNRDKDKRKDMGEISGKYANFTIITTDNPRFEDPMDIINDIEEGVLAVSGKYVIVQDRKQAIEYALNFAKEDDTVLIAGKGSEKYQEVLGIKHLYNDNDTVNEILGRLES